MLEQNKIYLGDCSQLIKNIDNKTVNLAIYDAPYFSTNIKEVGDKQWKNEEDYIDWCINLIKETQRVLKNNGSFYWFHNDVNIMTEILYRIKHETDFKLKNQITWSKINNWKSANIKDGAGMYRSILQCYGSQQSYNKSTTEFIYYFNFQDKTGSNIIKNTKGIIQSIKEYMRDEKKKSGLNLLQINQLFGINISDGIAKRYFGNSQWELPTKEKYEIMQATGFWQIPYDDLRHTFNQPNKAFKGKSVPEIREELKPYTTVWEYERDNNIYGSHLTPKPLKMIEHIVETSSNEGDVVLDGFLGSGTTVIACINKNREYIGIEKDEHFFNDATNRIINNKAS